MENLPDTGPVVLAPKHYSRWDPLAIALLSIEPLYFMTNANQFSGVQGWFIQRLGAFPVELNRPSLSSLRCAVELLQQGKKLVLFPEGVLCAIACCDR
uniref:Lysophospholipid acyltransferase family protein n=1 Tax=Desertifilum tharense IPPAS B-1220 TaxID=1781255 RepID=A0ACD5GP18_9CYAN